VTLSLEHCALTSMLFKQLHSFWEVSHCLRPRVYYRKILHVHAQWSRQQSEKRINKLSGELLKQMDIPGMASAFTQT